MPLDTRHIGHTFPSYSVDVEKGRLKFFAKAIGQDDPVYTDEAAAKAAGHPALPVPPTFLFCLEMDGAASNPFTLRELLDLPVPKVLHGEQRFTYHGMAYAGDTLTFSQRIADIYAKKGGLLEFVVRETRVTNQRGEHVADLHGITVVRHG
jgi:acyl dehydratase